MRRTRSITIISIIGRRVRSKVDRKGSCCPFGDLTMKKRRNM
jgi:hypothetical protein